MNKKFFHAIAMLIGMIVGVGIFGVPYAVGKVGFALGVFYILVLGLILLFLNFLYSEINLRTEGKHRLVGFAEIYLGKRGKMITGLAQIFSFYGALLAYIIIGGQFLHMILTPVFGGNLLVYQCIFFAFMSLAVLAGLRLVASIEFFMTFLLLAVVAVIILFGLPYVWYPNLMIVNFQNFFLPYGVILFALGGAAAIPEIRELLRGQEERIKKAVTVGTIVPIIVTILFVFVVIGISGSETTPETISGLERSLGPSIVLLGAVFGFLAIATSFLVLGLNLKHMFNYDYKINGLLSWLLACAVPFLVFLWLAPGFIKVISYTGAIFGGLEGIIIIFIWQKAKKIGKRKPEISLNISKLILKLLLAIFILGIFYQIMFGR